MVEIVTLEEFMDQTLGGRPNRANMTAYDGKEYECGCGDFHIIECLDQNNSEPAVIRELSGMRFVFSCQNGYVTCVKISGIFTVKLKSLFSAANKDTSDEASLLDLASQSIFSLVLEGADKLNELIVETGNVKDEALMKVDTLCLFVSVVDPALKEVIFDKKTKKELAGKLVDLIEYISSSTIKDLPFTKDRMKEYRTILTKNRDNPAEALFSEFRKRYDIKGSDRIVFDVGAAKLISAVTVSSISIAKEVFE